MDDKILIRTLKQEIFSTGIYFQWKILQIRKIYERECVCVCVCERKKIERRLLNGRMDFEILFTTDFHYSLSNCHSEYLSRAAERERRHLIIIPNEKSLRTKRAGGRFVINSAERNEPYYHLNIKYHVASSAVVWSLCNKFNFTIQTTHKIFNADLQSARHLNIVSRT